jgi:hypothetical protein
MIDKSQVHLSAGKNWLHSAHCPPIMPVSDTVERPFWSVMIPTYEPNLNYLEQALRSVLEQAPGPAEMQIELVDDHSNDFAAQLFLDKVAARRVSFYRQPQHKGIGGNWNTCLERARGHWVHILHQDDLVSPGFYSRLRAGVETDTCIGAAFCHNFWIDSEGGKTILPSRIKQDGCGIFDGWFDHVFIGLSFTCPSIVVKRAVYEQLGGFDTSFDYALDWDMWKRIASRFPLWHEPDALAGSRQHEQSTTRKLMRSGTNIAEIRRSIEISKSYLPVPLAAGMARRSENYYIEYAVTKAAKSLLVERDPRATLAQLNEARKIRSSAAVMKAIMRVAIKTVRAQVHRFHDTKN